MAVTLGPSGITFSDGNTQNTAASAGAKAEGTFTDFTTSANFTMPSNSVGVLVTMGGGGNGGLGLENSRGSALPGSPGSYCAGYITAADAPGSSPIVVGNGGSGVQGNTYSRIPGNPSSFRNNLLIANNSGNCSGNRGVMMCPGSGNYLGGNANVSNGFIGGNANAGIVKVFTIGD
ncbi:MAG: hypothetical protein VW270_13195 [Candidatus Poseidoniales archaeon]